MNGMEIRSRIIKLNDLINIKLTPGVFTLNEEVLRAQEEIKELQAMCPHEYDDLGFCIYCDARKN